MNLKNKELKIAFSMVLCLILCVGCSNNNSKEASKKSSNEGVLATTKIIELSKNNKNELAYDDTEDKNLRYYGKDPNNYVCFNDECPKMVDEYSFSYNLEPNGIETIKGMDKEECENVRQDHKYLEKENNITIGECKKTGKQFLSGGWRIIGVFNNVDDGNGNKESRVKLVRNTPLGSYSWDVSPASINSGNGVNEWSTSDIAKELNGDYINSDLDENTNWVGFSNRNIVFDHNKVLKKSAQDLIANAMWYTGTNSEDEYGMGATPCEAYKMERSNNTGKQCSASGIYSVDNCNDDVTRTTKWTGLVGLIYPSDYGFATDGGEKITRDECLKKPVIEVLDYLGTYEWKNSKGNTDKFCADKDWLYKNNDVFTITPSGNSVSSTKISAITGRGDVSQDYKSFLQGDIYPSVYLKKDVKIVSGDGKVSSPFMLS